MASQTQALSQNGASCPHLHFHKKEWRIVMLTNMHTVSSNLSWLTTLPDSFITELVVLSHSSQYRYCMTAPFTTSITRLKMSAGAPKDKHHDMMAFIRRAGTVAKPLLANWEKATNCMLHLSLSLSLCHTHTQVQTVSWNKLSYWQDALMMQFFIIKLKIWHTVQSQ